MDNTIHYASVLPENNKDSFEEFDNVDFVLAHEGRALNLGSVRLHGVVDVTQNNNPLTSTTDDTNLKDIKLDGMVGAHSFCESWTCEMNGQIVENITSYPRYVKMAMTATNGVDDMNNASNVCELKAPIDKMTNQALKGVVGGAGETNFTNYAPDFSIRPSICVNSGRGMLPYKKSGDIRLTVTLARVLAALYGLDVDSSTKYVLRDLRVVYTTSPEPESMSEPVMLRTKLNIKQSIQSSFSNVQTKVPAVCSAMSASFQSQANENQGKYNNMELNAVPNLTQTQFLFNDSTNTLVTYLIKNNVEVIGRYIDSFVDTGRNALSPAKLADNNGFGVGLNFSEEIDLSNQKFSVQLSSAVSSASPMIIYMYFHSMIQL